MSVRVYVFICKVSLDTQCRVHAMFSHYILHHLCLRVRLLRGRAVDEPPEPMLNIFAGGALNAGAGPPGALNAGAAPPGAAPVKFIWGAAAGALKLNPAVKRKKKNHENYVLTIFTNLLPFEW